jgi:hypothetical protein
VQHNQASQNRGQQLHSPIVTPQAGWLQVKCRETFDGSGKRNKYQFMLITRKALFSVSELLRTLCYDILMA